MRYGGCLNYQSCFHLQAVSWKMGISNKYGKYDSLQCKHYNPCSISCSRKRILRMDNTKQTLLDLTSFSMDYIYIYNCKWSKTTLTHDVALCVTKKKIQTCTASFKSTLLFWADTQHWNCKNIITLLSVLLRERQEWWAGICWVLHKGLSAYHPCRKSV